jgi:hypothetical protein
MMDSNGAPVSATMSVCKVPPWRDKQVMSNRSLTSRPSPELPMRPTPEFRKVGSLQMNFLHLLNPSAYSVNPNCLCTCTRAHWLLLGVSAQSGFRQYGFQTTRGPGAPNIGLVDAALAYDALFPDLASAVCCSDSFVHDRRT